MQDIRAASLVQFIASMEPTIRALENGDLDPLRPVLDPGIVYIRGRCDNVLLNLLGVERLPVLATARINSSQHIPDSLRIMGTRS